MTISLAALQVAIQTPGLGEAISGLRQVDAAGENAAEGVKLAQQALHKTGTEGSVVADIMQMLGAELRTVTGAIRESAEAMTKLAAKTDDAGDTAPPATRKLRGLADAIQKIGRAGHDAPLDAIAGRVRLLTTGLEGAGTRAQSLARLTQIEGVLQKQVAAGNLTLAQRIRVEEQLRAIEGARAGASAAGGVAAAGGGLLRGMLGGLAGVVTFGAIAGGIRAIGRASDDAAAAQRKLNATSKMTGVALSELQRIAGGLGDELALSEVVASDLTAMMTRMASRAGDTARTGEHLTNWLDLAAANGLTAAEALQALQTTLVDQDEGLNRLGLANPQQIYEAWAKAAGKSAAKMTEAEKAQARLQAVAEAAKKVQGEAAKSLNTTAGEQQKLARAAQDTAKAYGEAIDPMRRAMLEATTGTLEWLGANTGLVASIGSAAAAGTLTWGIFKLIPLVKTATLALRAMGVAGAMASLTAVALNPVVIGIGLVAAAIGALVWQMGAGKREAKALREELGQLSDEDQLQKQLALSKERLELQQKLEQERRERELAEQRRKDRGYAPLTPMEKGLEAVRSTNPRSPMQQRADEIDRELKVLAELQRARAAAAPPPAPPGGDTGGEAVKTGELISALADLHEVRRLTADEQRLALSIEDELIAKRDKLANITSKTAAQTLALAEAEQRLAEIQAVSSSYRGPDITRAVIGPRSPGWTGLTPIDPQRQGAAIKPKTTVDALETEFRSADQINLGERLRIDEKQFTEARETLAAGLAGALTGGIAAGFEEAFASGSITTGFKALSSTLLSGFGQAMVDFGQASLITATLMEKIKASLMSFLPGGAVVASLAMIAAGAALSGVARKAFGNKAAGSGGGASLPAWNDTTSRITVGTPAATIPGGAGGVAGAGAQAAAPAPVVHIGSLVALDPHDGQWQRLVTKTVQEAYNRNIIPMPPGGFTG
jgi:hypothetical protein